MEFIIVLVALVLVIMLYGRIAKALDWTGSKIDQTSDILDDIIVGGTKQSARARITSDDTLHDTVLESIKAEAKRVKEKSKFKSSLSEAEKKAVESREKRLQKLLDRHE